MHIKNSKRAYFVCILSLFLLMLMMPFSTIIQATSPQAASANDAYEYPIKPGTEEWKAFKSHDDMLKACQIPESTLKSMSTKGLVETVLEYPLFGDMMAYSSIQQGFEAVASRFNGLSELLNRKDAGTELLAVYSKMNPQDIEENLGDVQKGAHIFSIANVEILLAQNKILDNLNKIQLENLIVEARSKYTAKQQSEMYGQSNLDRTQQLIEQVAQRHYTPRWYYSYVYTPRETAVLVMVDRTELSPEEIAYYREWVFTHYPFASRRRDASAKYNCHSYAWYSQSASNNKWMNNPSAYWTDGSYYRLHLWWMWWNNFEPYPDSKMRWVSADHSGIFQYSISGIYYCVSKWGEGPLMYHPATYCPYDSTTIYYYYR